MKKLAILVSYSGDGGVERVINLLAGELARDVHVDLLTIKFKGAHVHDIPPNVRVLRLRAQHALSAIGEIADYLRRERPDLLLAAKDRAGRAALAARRKTDVALPVWLQLHTNISQSLAGRGSLMRRLRLHSMRRAYPLADGIIAVSDGVRADLVSALHLAPERVHTIHNPAIPRDIAQRAAEPVPHPWLTKADGPVIVGMGRLTQQKDFATLLRAFAALQAQRPSRLIVLGEGRERGQLEQLAQALGIAERVLFPGFQSNPYAWLGRADLFVLSSRWEGFGNVLAEALALGIPSVATDCPSGPIEILDRGRYGPLAAVGDHLGLASAMQATLAAPLPSSVLRQAAEAFHAPNSARRYLQVLGLKDTSS